MARLGVCATCQAKNVGPSHYATATHRAKTYRTEHIPDLVGADESHDRARILRAFRSDTGTAEQNDAAMRRLNGEPPVWADEAPLPEPWEDPEYREPRPAIRGVTLAPCPRCGRRDFRTDKGRSWHLANVPSCRSYIRPGRHEYVTISA